MTTMTPWNLLDERARETPGRVAHQVDDDTLTYADWKERALARAEELASRIRAGARVVLEYDREAFLAYSVDYLAVLRLRATVVPVSTDTSAQARKEILGITRASVVLRPGAILDLGEQREDANYEETPAEIIFTSGTTGAPKGWACWMAEVCNEWDLIPSPLAERGRDVHGAAFGTNYMQEMLRSPLLWGSQVLTPSRPTGRSIIELARAYDANTLRLTPTLAHALVRVAGPGALQQIRDISVSSAYCPPELLAQLQEVAPRARIVNQYSLTESGRAKLKSVWGESPQESLGRPVEGTQVRVIDETGTEVPPGTSGELQLRHVHAPVRTNLEQVAPDPEWVSTGDLGFYSDNGYVYLVDRLRDLLHVGGRKVSPLAVERMLLRDPGVLDVCVASRPHPTLGEVPVAAVQVAPGASLDSIALDALALHERPVQLREVEEVPRNAAGKAMRSSVRELFTKVTEHIPSDEMSARQSALLQVIHEVLETEYVDLKVSWYAADGDSLSAVELMATVEEEFGFDLTPDLFGPDRTVQDILDIVESRGSRN